jgi:hypothetical protein
MSSECLAQRDHRITPKTGCKKEPRRRESWREILAADNDSEAYLASVFPEAVQVIAGGVGLKGSDRSPGPRLRLGL